MDARNIEDFQFGASGVSITVLAVLGFIGNVISLTVLSKSEMRSSVNCGLQGLAVFDTFVLLCSVLTFGLPSLGIKISCFHYYKTQIFPRMVPFVYPLALVAQTGSVWTTVGVTVERYIAVCHPLKARSLCTYNRAQWCNILIAIFSICYNLPRFWETEMATLINPEDNTTILEPRASELRQNRTYFIVYYMLLYLFVMYFLPFGILTILNVFIWISVKKANKNRHRLSRRLEKEINMALMLFCVVVIFFVCNLLALIANILEYCEIFLVPLVDFSNCLVTFNSSVNFVIYCIFGKKFRKVFKKVYCRYSTSSSERIIQKEQADMWTKFRNGKSTTGSITLSGAGSIYTKM